MLSMKWQNKDKLLPSFLDQSLLSGSVFVLSLPLKYSITRYFFNQVSQSTFTLGIKTAASVLGECGFLSCLSVLSLTLGNITCSLWESPGERWERPGERWDSCHVVSTLRQLVESPCTEELRPCHEPQEPSKDPVLVSLRCRQVCERSQVRIIQLSCSQIPEL